MVRTNIGGSAVLLSFSRVFDDASEAARIRGFPSPSLDGFGFVVALLTPVYAGRRQAV